MIDRVLRDLQIRLEEKAGLLLEMSEDKSNSRDERMRLRGKAQGMNLARTFVLEALRMGDQ